MNKNTVLIWESKNFLILRWFHSVSLDIYFNVNETCKKFWLLVMKRGWWRQLKFQIGHDYNIILVGTLFLIWLLRRLQKKRRKTNYSVQMILNLKMMKTTIMILFHDDKMLIVIDVLMMWKIILLLCTT